MSDRFEYDLMLPDEFDQRLNDLDMKRDAFAYITGVRRTKVQQWHQGKAAIPHWVRLLLALLERHNANIMEARQIAAEHIRMDHEAPEEGLYPFLEKEDT